MKENTACERCDALGDAFAGATGGNNKIGDSLPREPEKYCL